MFTAKLTNKEETQQGLRVTVEFSNGTDTLTESVIPQDRAGFDHWVKSRLASLNTLEEMKTEDNVGQVIDVSEPAPVDTRTQAEKDRDAWFKLYYRWVNVKNNLIDPGVVPATHPKAQALLSEVKAGLQADYIDYI